MSEGDRPQCLLCLFLPASSELFCRLCATDREAKVTALNVMFASLYQPQEAFPYQSCAGQREANMTIPDVMLAPAHQFQEAFASQSWAAKRDTVPNIMLASLYQPQEAFACESSATQKRAKENRPQSCENVHRYLTRCLVYSFVSSVSRGGLFAVRCATIS